MNDLVKNSEFDALIPYITAIRVVRDESLNIGMHRAILEPRKRFSLVIELPQNMQLDIAKIDSYFTQHGLSTWAIRSKTIFDGVLKDNAVGEYLRNEILRRIHCNGVENVNPNISIDVS